MKLIREFIRDYFVIFGVLIIGSVFLTPPSTINRDYILLVMAFAFIGNLPSLVFWSREDLSEKSRKLRSIIHFILLLTLLLIFAGIAGIVTKFGDYIFFSFEIVIIYGIVKFIIYQGDINTAKEINEKLKNYRKTEL